ncbi:MAG: hypothetical protein H6577_03440 [Lewinellaceae bacterium]|nr:hypothetical protein [Saprospiraceae bacterium]MCB9337157.1 hypothetical protein [Lewinellaceae bacterium]
MQNSRLIELFSALEKIEQRELGKFVRSPVYNQRQDVVDLYDYLYQNAPFTKAGTIERAAVFTAIFPGETFDSAKMDYTMSFLFQVTKAWLIYKEQAADSVANQVLLARALRRRNLERLFDKEIKTAEKSLESQPYRNSDFHYQAYRLHFEKQAAASRQNRNSTTSFQEFSSELTTFFIAQKLWQACSTVIYQTVFQADIQQAMLAEVLAHVERGGYENVPAVNLYYHCYKALTEENSQPWFAALRDLLQQHYQAFPVDELKDLHLLAINYCIKRFNTGETAFLKEAFQLYQEGLSIGVFLENNSLSRYTYNNIVMAGLLLKEFDWVENFLHEYRDSIEAKYRESTFNYNLAIYYFQKPDYEKAMDLLQRADFDDVMHNLNARRMLLKIYFEKDEREALNSLITSFKNFIYRHRELGAYHRALYMNLLKFTKRLLNIRPNDKEAFYTLKVTVEAAEPVAEKAWLLKVLEGLSG